MILASKQISIGNVHGLWHCTVGWSI